MAVPNPWLKLKDEALKIRTPVLILNRQADMLHEATDGLIRGRADVEGGRLDRAETVVAFRAHVPTLNNYAVRLFRVSQPVTQYPAILIPEWGGRGPVTCEDDKGLEAAVVDYCEGPHVQKIVTGLLAQARQAMGETE